MFPLLEQVAEQTVNRLMIWDVMALMWRHCNVMAYLQKAKMEHVLYKQISLRIAIRSRSSEVARAKGLLQAIRSRAWGILDQVTSKDTYRVCMNLRLSAHEDTIVSQWYTGNIPGTSFEYKIHLSRYRTSYHKDKTIVRPSYLYNGIPYTFCRRHLYIKGPIVFTQQRATKVSQ